MSGDGWVKTGLALHQKSRALDDDARCLDHFFGAAGVTGGFGFVRAASRFRGVARLDVTRLQGRDDGEGSEG